MKSFLAAVALLTRIPVGTVLSHDASEAAGSGAWFPVVGILLGLMYSMATVLLRGHLPPLVIAVLLVILDALATGALHYDGLADMADGFGGGKDREDILRIMRDHAIGSYGAVALAGLVVLKTAAYAAVLNQSNWAVVLIVTPALSRWSILLLTSMLPYAREAASVVDGMGKRSLILGSAVVAGALIGAMSVRACFAAIAVLAISAGFGFYCRRRIGGITGDTLGANVQLCESGVLLTFIWTA